MIGRIRFQDEKGVLAVHGAALVSVWSGKASLHLLEQVPVVAAEIVRDHAHLVSLTVITAVRVERTSSAERAAIQAVNAALAAHLRGDAYVVDIDSLMGVAIRTLLAGVNLVTRGRHDTELFGYLPKACAWLGERSAAVNPTELEGFTRGLISSAGTRRAAQRTR